MDDDARVTSDGSRDRDDRDPDGSTSGPLTAALAGADTDADASDEDPPREPIEPESVNPEHAAFVLLGVVLTFVVVASVL